MDWDYVKTLFVSLSLGILLSTSAPYLIEAYVQNVPIASTANITTSAVTKTAMMQP